MAVIYLRSTDGSDASDGSSWTDAKATLAAALTAAGDGGIVYVSQAHAETQASAMTLTSPGAAATPVRVICINDGTGAIAATATVSTTGASSITISGFAYCYGVAFTAGDGTSGANITIASITQMYWRFEACALILGGSNSGNRINIGNQGAGQSADWINTTVQFAHVSHAIAVSGRLRWLRTPRAVTGATIPTTLFAVAANRGGIVEINGVDLSALSTGKNLFGVATGMVGEYRIENSKLGDAVAIEAGTRVGPGSPEVRAVNCDSADTNYRYYRGVYQGLITQETTIVRTGGASDGTTPVSRKMVSSAGSKFYSPLESDPMVVWNETLGELTATVEVVTDGVTLTDAEAWLEVEYLGTSGYPLALTASDRAASIVATPANQAASSETWTTTGLASPVTQKLSATFTPAEKGPVAVRVMLAKASTTMYFDPQVGLTSGREYMIPGAFLNEPAAGAGAAGYSRGRVVNQ